MSKLSNQINLIGIAVFALIFLYPFPALATGEICANTHLNTPAYAPQCCQQPASSSPCQGTRQWIGSAAGERGCETPIANPFVINKNQSTFLCSSNSWTCGSGYTVCGTSCVDNATPETPAPGTCAALNKDWAGVCNPSACGACKAGYADVGGNCIKKVEVARTATDTYRALDNVTLEDFFVAIAQNATCAIGQVPTWNDNSTPGDLTDDKWTCGAGGFWTASGNHITNSNTGNVGIGSATPGAKLDVGNVTRINGTTWPTTGSGLVLAYDTPSSTGYVLPLNSTAGTYGNLFLGSGKVGIGIVSPLTTLDVVGSVRFAGESGIGGLGGIDLNASSNFDTNINTGASTGTVNIGGGANLVTVNSSKWSVDSSGNLDSVGCFGPVLQGATVSTYNGNQGGYYTANSRCPATQHVCTTAETLNSINCGKVSTSGLANGTSFWISNGAPALPQPTDDCRGWTIADSTWNGVKWKKDANGGVFYAASCDNTFAFACCK